MYSYELISDRSSVPPMTDLGEPYVRGPSSRGGVSYLTFPKDFGFEVVRYEGAVGARCRVVRTRDRESQERGGAVSSVSPLRVTLDGGGWQ
jgi:hypothetical protein